METIPQKVPIAWMRGRGDEGKRCSKEERGGGGGGGETRTVRNARWGVRKAEQEERRLHTWCDVKMETKGTPEG